MALREDEVDTAADAIRLERDRLAAIAAMAQTVERAESLDDVFEAGLAAIESVTGADRSSILLFDDADVMRFRAWHGLSAAYRAAVDGHSPWTRDAVDPVPLLIGDAESDDAAAAYRQLFAAEGIRSLAFVPLVHGGSLIGKFMLYGAEPHAFGEEEVRLAATIASHIASATMRMRAEDELRESRAQLEAVFAGVADGITAIGADGTLRYANDAAAHLCGLSSAQEMLAVGGAELLSRFEIVGEDGAPLPLDALPSRRAFAERAPCEGTLGYRSHESGETRWSIVRSTPILGEDDAVRLVINVFHDVTEQREAESRMRFLAEAGELLSASLDYESTLRDLAALLVPGLADYCLVDAVEEDGSLRQVVIAHRDVEKEQLLHDVRRRYPPEVNESHPVSRVLRTGRPVLIEDARAGELERAAVDEEHLALYRALEAVSYIVAPLEARGRLLGTLSLGTGGSGRVFRREDLELVHEVARRAALAIDNALLFRSAQRSYAQLETLLVSAPVGIGFWDRELRFVRVNDALAAINGLAPEEHVGRSLEDVIPRLAPRLEPLYRRVLETGEPIVHEETTDATLTGPGAERHWLSSYYPVRTEDGETIGIGGVIMETTAQRRADARLHLLAEAGELFASSLEQAEILRRISRVVVPRIADACNIYLADGGVLDRVAYAHADPEREELMAHMPDRYVVGDGAPAVLRRVLAGEPLLVPTLDEALVRALEEIGLDREAFERVGSRSMMFVPFVSRGQTLGVITLGSLQAGRYAEADLELAVEIAGRASAALDNARLVQQVTLRTTLLEAQQEASLDGLLLVGPDGSVASYNRRFVELWGLSEAAVASGSDDALLGEAVEKVADPEGFLRRVRHLYAHPEETGWEEIELKDGRVFDRYGTAVYGPDGTYHGFLWSFRDQTERRRAEAELRAQLQLTSTITDNATSALFLMDERGHPTYLNAAAEAMFGYSLEEIRDRPLHYAVHHLRPDGSHYPMEECPIDRALPEQKWIEPYEDVFVRKDGTFVHVAAAASPIVRDGVPVGTVVEVRDLTEEKRIQAEREAAEARVRFLAEASEALAESFDLEQTLRVVAGLAVPRVADLCIVDLLAPDGRIEQVAAVRAGDPTFAERIRPFVPSVGDDHPVSRVLRGGRMIARGNVDHTWLNRIALSPEHGALLREIGVRSLVFVPIRSGRRTLGVITFGRTEGRPYADAERDVVQELARRASVAIENARLYAETESRAQAATALEFVGDGVVLVDDGGFIRLWNPGAERATGIPAADAVDRPAAEVLAGWPLDDLSLRPQTRPVDVHGRELWLSITAVAFERGTVYAFRDLTEERAVEQLKSDFVSTVSHELRTPLAAIYGAAMTLRREDVALGDAHREGMLSVIADESERLARIVNDILLASRLDSGAQTMSIEDADAASIARAVLAAAETHLPQGTELALRALEPGPRVAADPDALRQVLVNLVENAVKYSPDGGLVELELDETDGRVRFAVRDRGLGIPAADRERIFEKFFRLDPNLSRGVGGTGLGLYISRELVRRMGGRLRVESEVGRGSTFWFDLPAA